MVPNGRPVLSKAKLPGPAGPATETVAKGSPEKEGLVKKRTNTGPLWVPR